MRCSNTPPLETERLRLRRFREDDVEDMFPLYSDAEVNRFLPWYPFRTIEQTREYLHASIYPEYKKDTAYCYALELKETNQVIGYICVTKIDRDTASGELGYGLRREYWNRGLMTEAADAVLERLRGDGFAYIIATHDVQNPASGRVMQKLGMTYQGAYEEQWQPKNIPVTFHLYRIDLRSDTP